eukprot:6214314-Pleurochrysis_carterae.AAC.1
MLSGEPLSEALPLTVTATPPLHDDGATAITSSPRIVNAQISIRPAERQATMRKLCEPRSELKVCSRTSFASERRAAHQSLMPAFRSCNVDSTMLSLLLALGSMCKHPETCMLTETKRSIAEILRDHTLVSKQRQSRRRGCARGGCDLAAHSGCGAIAVNVLWPTRIRLYASQDEMASVHSRVPACACARAKIS